MPKVQLIPDCNEDGRYNACAYIRVLDPLKLVAKKGLIELSSPSRLGEATDADIVYIQRFGNAKVSITQLQSYVEYCKKNKKKIIYEMDDNLLDVPAISLEEKCKVRFLIRSADVVVVSTEPLKERILAINSNVCVIPNMLSQGRIDNKFVSKSSERIKIGYMGTFTHQADFQMVLLPLMKVLTKYKNSVELELVGSVSDLGLIGTLPNVRTISIEGRDHYPEFWKWTKKEINWDIGIAPLKLNEFTVCKSDIKFLDYAGMNCCGVFSDHPAYSKTIEHGKNGMLAGNSADSWTENLERLILDKRLRESLTQAARHELYQRRLLESNFDRWALLF